MLFIQTSSCEGYFQGSPYGNEKCQGEVVGVFFLRVETETGESKNGNAQKGEYCNCHTTDVNNRGIPGSYLALIY